MKRSYRISIAAWLVFVVAVTSCVNSPDGQLKKNAAANDVKALATKLGYAPSDYLTETAFGHDFTQADYFLIIATQDDIPAFDARLSAIGSARLCNLSDGSSGSDGSTVFTFTQERLYLNGKRFTVEDGLKFPKPRAACRSHDSFGLWIYEFKPLLETYSLDNTTAITSNILIISNSPYAANFKGLSF